ncbi:MAG TPA: hypothetical protein H9683_06365, partial [Firmicutes bacterium]|nr:hypothetical protein [Bacillota bacterium]
MRHLLSALPFIVFVILEYYYILFSITTSSSRQLISKSYRKKCKAIKSGQDGRSGAAKPAARAVWHGQGFQ